jgi:DNA-binding transcriptional LysR family regulator
VTPTFADLRVFVTVARFRSFRRAATERGVSPSALSHSMRGLERLLGVRLLNRTTRSVSLTEAGQHLLEKLGPALDEVGSALALVQDFRASPRGTVRINAPQEAVRLLLRHVVPEVLKRHPDITLDLVSDDRLVDVVGEGFDAGVRLGETVPQDMVGVPFGGPARFVAVASPCYLDRMGVPDVPDDLCRHSCIRHRLPGGRIYSWEFEKRGQAIAVDVSGSLTLNGMDLMLDAAASGLGIAFVMEAAAASRIADGRLVVVLEDWSAPFGGLMLYYPGHRQVPAALRAFIDILKERLA